MYKISTFYVRVFVYTDYLRGSLTYRFFVLL